jgi:hypothetical protein
MAGLVSGAMHLTDTLMYPYGSKGPSHPGVVARSNLNSSETNGKYCCEKEQHSCTVKVLERRERPGRTALFLWAHYSVLARRRQLLLTCSSK